MHSDSSLPVRRFQRDFDPAASSATARLSAGIVWAVGQIHRQDGEGKWPSVSRGDADVFIVKASDRTDDILDPHLTDELTIEAFWIPIGDFSSRHSTADSRHQLPRPHTSTLVAHPSRLTPLLS